MTIKEWFFVLLIRHDHSLIRSNNMLFSFCHSMQNLWIQKKKRKAFRLLIPQKYLTTRVHYFPTSYIWYATTETKDNLCMEVLIPLHTDKCCQNIGQFFCPPFSLYYFQYHMGVELPHVTNHLNIFSTDIISSLY